MTEEWVDVGMVGLVMMPERCICEIDGTKIRNLNIVPFVGPHYLDMVLSSIPEETE